MYLFVFKRIGSAHYFSPNGPSQTAEILNFIENTAASFWFIILVAGKFNQELKERLSTTIRHSPFHI